MMAYPTEQTRGKYVAIFWIFFNMGGVIGGLIALGINLADQSSGGVSDSKLRVFSQWVNVGRSITQVADEHGI